MATEIISTDLTSQYLVDGSDTLILNSGVSIAVSGADAIHTRSNLDSGISLILLGQVTATGLASPGLGASAVFLGGTFTNGAFDPSHNSVTVGATGTLEALGGFGIFSFGSESTVSNFGTIDAVTGMVLRGGSNRIENAGVISAADTGININGTGSASKGEMSLIHNSGTIQTGINPGLPAGNGWGIGVFENWVSIVNDGIIAATHGIVSQGRHMSVMNSGAIAATEGSAISFQFGDGLLSNSGTLTSTGFFAAVSADGLEFTSTHGLAIINSGQITSEA